MASHKQDFALDRVEFLQQTFDTVQGIFGIDSVCDVNGIFRLFMNQVGADGRSAPSVHQIDSRVA